MNIGKLFAQVMDFVPWTDRSGASAWESETKNVHAGIRVPSSKVQLNKHRARASRVAFRAGVERLIV